MPNTQKTLTDNTIKANLIELFKEEGKTDEEINSIMTHQENYYQMRQRYFIPARFTKVIASMNEQTHTNQPTSQLR